MDPLDLDRLERVRRWAAVPVAERGAEWVREFEAAFWPAPLLLPQEPEYGSTRWSAIRRRVRSEPPIRARARSKASR